MKNKRILIIGGTGALGKTLISTYNDFSDIMVFSRDEHKHWKMKLAFNSHKNLNFIIGNVHNKQKVAESIKRVKPDIIIIACAMKHIDQCEVNTGESLRTNLLGTKMIFREVDYTIFEVL